jgi:hypothetical protein
MSSLGWAILLVGFALAAAVAWVEYRVWRAWRDDAHARASQQRADKLQ